MRNGLHSSPAEAAQAKKKLILFCEQPLKISSEEVQGTKARVAVVGDNFYYYLTKIKGKWYLYTNFTGNWRQGL